MTYEEFEKIMDADVTLAGMSDDNNAFLGLKIIRKYLSIAGIEAADHDIIYSVDVKALLAAGIIQEDAEKLRELNWMIDNGSMACFV